MSRGLTWKLACLVLILGVAAHLAGCGPAVGGGAAGEPEPPAATGGSVIAELRILTEDMEWGNHQSWRYVEGTDIGHYPLRVRNVGDARGRIRIREHIQAPAVRFESRMFYIDDMDITAQAKGDGWYTPALDPGQELYIRLEFNMRADAPGNERGVGTSLVRAFADNTEQVMPKLQVGPVTGVLPELRIRQQGGDWSKNIEAMAREGNMLNLEVEVKNVGTKAGEISVFAYTEGMNEDKDDWSLSAAANAVDISNQLMGGGWSADYTVNQTRIINLDVFPEDVVKGDKLKIYVGGTADTYDVVIAEIEMEGVHQPNLHLSVQGGDFIGVDLYDSTGESKRQSVEAGNDVQVDYLIRIRNDGDFTDSFRLVESGYGGGWIVRYYNAETGGTEITLLIRGAGWLTGNMTVGEMKTIRAEIVPGGRPDGDRLVLPVTAISQGYTYKRDAVIQDVLKIARGLRIGDWREEIAD